MGANETVILNWFKLLKELKDKFHIVSPYQVWSGDETGVQNVLKEQMPKRSRKEERAKSMVSAGKLKGEKAPAPAPRSSNTAPKRKDGKPINIPLKDVSPEVKAILVQGLLKEGKAVIVRGKGKGKGKSG